MRELDRLLEGFLDTRFEGLEPADQARFGEILEYPDPDLHAYLVGRAEPEDPAIARLFAAIRASGTP